MKLRVRYPCGLDVRINVNVFMAMFSLEFDFKEGCPLHKFNCPPKEK